MRSRDRSAATGASDAVGAETSRSAYARAADDAKSSHCESSIATSTGCRSASARSAFMIATPTRVRSMARLFVVAEYQRARQAPDAVPPEAAERILQHGSSKSPMPAYARSSRSRPAGPAVQHSPQILRVSTPARHSVVFPIPASPSSTSAALPAMTRSTKSWSDASSASRPTTKVSIGRLIVRLVRTVSPPTTRTTARGPSLTPGLGPQPDRQARGGG